MSGSIHWKVNLGFGLTLVLLLAISLVSFRTLNRLVETVHLEVRSHEVLNQLDDLFLQLQNAETGQRGYLITGEERYLEPYHLALRRIHEEYGKLLTLSQDDPDRLTELAHLKLLMTEKLAELEDTIGIRRTEGFEATLPLVRTDRGKHLMDEIRSVMEHMEDAERTLLYTRDEAATGMTARAILLIAFLATLSGALAALAALLINRDVRSRARAEAAIRRANEQLEERVQDRTRALAQVNETLRAQIALAERAEQALEQSRDDTLSILNQLQIGTLRTDPEGRVLFASRMATEILGRADEAVQGRPWEEILSLRDEDQPRLRAELHKAAPQRHRVPVHLQREDGRQYWMEVDVRDDPRVEGGRILFLYDLSELHDLRRLLGERSEFQGLIGSSPTMQTLYERIREAARVDATVLIEGETGTGKELVARAIHDSSPRRNNAFVAVNCAGLTESLLGSQLFGHVRGAFTGAVAHHRGLFETADGGTAFLDEVGDLPVSVQTSLLRVLQEHEITRLGESVPRRIDVRILAATHHDLQEEVTRGNFRADLFYRIRVVRIHLPPLRKRREDIPLLVARFLEQLAGRARRPVPEVSGAAMRCLLSYAWPGNVRELRSAIEFAYIGEKPVLQPADLPPEVLAGESLLDPGDLAGLEARRIRAALERAGNNRTLAASLLGISRATLYRHLARLGKYPSDPSHTE